MSGQFTSSIVRILNAKGKIVGAGFLVSQKHVLTCAHVVAQALGLPPDTGLMPEGKAGIDFPLLSEGRTTTGVLTGSVIFWQPLTYPLGRGGDIALLELENDPPRGSRPCRPIMADDLWAHSFRVFGFPYGCDNGIWASGVIRDRLANGWVEIEDDKATGFFVAKGFSGAPVWDDKADGIVGMIVSAESASDIRVAYIIPTSLLFEALPDLARLNAQTCPYLGLNTFREEDAAFFFGRESFIKRLMEAVYKRSLVAVIGPSGSGKSSVVFAGLIPSLRAKETWFTISFRPGHRPWQPLAAAIVPLLEPQLRSAERLVQINKLSEELDQGKVTVQNIMEEILRVRPGAHLLLVVDQFEELYTLCQEKDVRQQLIDQLLTATQVWPNQSRQNFTLIITLRADFLGHALSYRPLADALQQADLKLGPMNRQELQAVIEKPAHNLKVQIEHGLTERILKAISQAPGALPLCEFALTLLWKKQKAGTLTHAAYDEIGGVEKALALYAEEVYAQFNEDEQKRIRKIFIQLVRPGEGTEDTRRLATRTEVKEDNWDLISRLADARLLISGKDEATGEETVEIVHEALIEGWDRLHDWIEADRTFRTWQERLRALIEQWENSRRDEGALLRGAVLNEAENWLQKRYDDLSTSDLAFIRAGLARREQQLAQRERLHRRIIFGITTGLVTALILAITAIFFWLHSLKQRRFAEEQRQQAEEQRHYAEEQRQQADIQRRIALARQLIAQAELMRNQRADSLPLSVLLAVQAVQWAPSVEAGQTLRQGLALLARPITCLKHQEEITDVDFSPNGDYLATAGKGPIAFIWETNTGQEITQMKHDGDITAVVFSPDGKYLATASDDHTARVWNIANGAEVARMNHSDTVNAIAFSPDGKYLASASDDHTGRVWDTDNGQERFLINHGDRVTAVAFSPDGEYIATASDDGASKVLETINGQELGFVTHEDTVTAVTFSPDGEHLATASADGFVCLWKMSNQGPGAPMIAAHTIFEEVFRISHAGKVYAVAFSPAGKHLATASADFTARVWEMAGRKEVSRAVHKGRVTAVTFSPDGKYLATAGEDNTARVWEVKTGREVIRLAHKGEVHSVIFSRDGQYLATASADHTARVYEASSIRKNQCLAHAWGVREVFFSPEGKYLATLGMDHTARVWEVEHGREVACLKHEWEVTSVASSPDNRYLATVAGDHTARIREKSSGREVGCLDHKVGLDSAFFSPEGRYLATVGFDSTIRVWQMMSGREVFYLSQPGDIKNAGFSQNGAYLITSGADQTKHFWDITSGQKMTSASALAGEKVRAENLHTTIASGEAADKLGAAFMKHGWKVTAIAFSQDGQYVATASDDYTARIWQTGNGRQCVCMNHKGKVEALSFSKDGKYLITVDDDQYARVWEATSGREIAYVKAPGKVSDIGLGPNGKYMVVISDNNGAIIWEIMKNRKIAQIMHQGQVKAFTFSPDGQYLATANSVHIVHLWEVESGRPICSLPLKTDISSIDFSPDGEHIGAVCSDNSVWVWEAHGSREVTQLAHENFIHDIAFSPDGKFLATATSGHNAWIWDIASGRQVSCIPHEANVYAVAFSPDGKFLATAGADHITQLCLWQPKDMIDEACSRLDRNLTEKEWSLYVGDEPYCKTCPGLPSNEM